MYLYVAADMRRGGAFEAPALAATTERHHLPLCRPALHAIGDPAVEMASHGSDGVVFELATGLPSPPQLDAAERVLGGGTRVWVYWPAEGAVECLDCDRIASLRTHLRSIALLRGVGLPMCDGVARFRRMRPALRWIYRGAFPVRRSDLESKLDFLVAAAQPVPLQRPATTAQPRTVLYLRTDYWKPSEHVPALDPPVRALATFADHLVCLTPHGPDDGGDRIRHINIGAPASPAGQDGIVLAREYYLPIVRTACQMLRPLILYERLTLGQSVGAELSQTLRLPYVLEYAGRAAITREAIGDAAPAYPDIYTRAEELALRQATAVLVPTEAMRDTLVARGIEHGRVFVSAEGDIHRLLPRIAVTDETRPCGVETGDLDKDRIQRQWNENPAGSHYARLAQPRTLDWFLEIERHRYGAYAPWMPDVMEFARHGGNAVLEIGGGVGTDLAQFAMHGARVTDIDLAAGHLALAAENFHARGLDGRFVQGDAESLPFPDASFDLVYSNGVLHHTPNTRTVVAEIRRVLRPGGRAIVMLYAENSLHYWRKLVWRLGVRDGLLDRMSMGEIMSRTVERSANGAQPLVKVYTAARAGSLFSEFDRVSICRRQLLGEELPGGLQWAAGPLALRLGWNLIVKAVKRP